MQFLKDFSLIVASLLDSKQSEYPSQRIANIIFVITFLQRVSLLFPFDGYNLNIYQDQSLYIIYHFISPFNVSSILRLWGDATLIYIVVTLIALVNLFMILTLISLTILYRLELYDPLNPKEILSIVSTIVYKYIMYLEYTLYIPMISILLGSINCDIMANQTMCPLSFTYGMVIFALGSLITMTFITVFFFRTYKYWPENIIKKKFSYISFWMPVINFIHIYLNNSGGKNFNNAIKLVFANMMGIIWIYELNSVCPYVPDLNQMMFYCAIVYQTITIILTFAIASNFTLIQLENQIVYFLFYGSLILFLFTTINHRQKVNLIKQQTLNQSEIIQLIQLTNQFQLKQAKNIDNKIQSSKIILWYQVLVNHLQLCKQIQCRERGYILFNQKTKKYHQITKYLSKCLLITQLNFMKNQKNCFYETLELFYISFQDDECNESLPAFCQLKLYQQRTEIHTFQFQCLKDSLNLQLKNKIIQKQKSLQKILSNDISDKQLTTAQIYQTEELREKYISLFQEIIDLKINYWVSLINGYNDIADYSQQVFQLSIKLNSIKVQLEKDLCLNLSQTFKPNQNTNVLILKILSIYFSMGINDNEYCMKCEDYIEEILRSELSYSSDLIFNANIIKDQVVLLSISTMKNRGHLIYKNKLQIAKYFGYLEMKEFDNIKHVNQLMPDFVKKIHDQILSNFLAKGQSDRFVKAKMLFLKDCDGFIFPANQKIQNFFEQTDDYVLTAEFNKIRDFNDYILFDNTGQILGITKSLFKIINASVNINLERLLECYIFLFMPDIIDIIKNRIKQLNLGDDESYHQDQQNYLNIPKDFVKCSDQFQQFYSSHKFYNASRHIILNNDKEVFKRQQNHEKSIKKLDQLEINQTHESEKLIQNCQIQLLNKDYQIIIEEFFTQIRKDQKKEGTTQYIIQNILEFRKITSGENNYTFFFIEITDIKNKQYNMGQTTITESNYQNNTAFTNQSHNMAIENIVQIPFQIEPSNILQYNFQAEKIKQVYFSQDISEIQEFKESSRQHDQPNLESDRYSQWLGPISQRQELFEPSSHRSQTQIEDYRGIELDFKNLCESQNMNSTQNKGGLNQSNQDQINTLIKQGPLLKDIKESIEDIEIQNQCSIKNQGSIKNQDSHQIENVINRHRRNIIHNEPEINQSNSSRTSMTARRGTLDIIKGLRNRRKFNKDLQQISIVYSTVILFIFLSMVVSLILNYTNAQILMNRVNDVIEPQKFSNEYFTILTYGWLNLAQKINLISLDKYLEQRILNQTQNIKTNLNIDMLARYQIFALIEDQGLLDKLNISYVDQPHVNEVEFSVFFFLTLDKMNAVLDLDFTSQEIDNQFLMDLLYLRENLGQIVKVNQDLIDTITMIYQSDIVLIDQQFFGVISSDNMEKILDHLIKNIDVQFKSTPTTSRVNAYEVKYNDHIRYLVAKDILQQNTKTKWKLLNYFDLMYNQIEDIDQGVLQIDMMKYKAIVNPIKSSKVISSKNRNSKSTLLSTRIRQTNISGKKEILLTILILIITIMYLVGGYIILVLQEQVRAPSETLVMQLVKFQNQIDTLMISGLLAKTQFLVYPLLIERNYFSINHAESITNIKLQKTDYVIDFFQQTFDYTQSHLDHIWQDIQGDELLQNDQQATILNIFKVSLCINMYDELPFCQLDILGIINFQQTYGAYDDLSNDALLVNSGLINIFSTTFQNIKQSFNYELQNNSYLQDAELLKIYVQSMEFFNTFVSYFLDYDKASSLIQDMIVFQIEFILYSGSLTAQTYFLASGFTLLIFLVIFFRVWLEKKNKEIQYLMMGITNIPIEALFEPQMMVMLKKMDDQ